MKIGIKLTAAFILIAFLPIVIIGYISYQKGKESLEEESFAKLTAVRKMKANQIEAYFRHITDQVLTFSENPTIVQAMEEFKNSFHTIEDELEAHRILEIDSVRSRLRDYMLSEYLPRLNKNLEIKSSVDEDISNDMSTLILQDLYIASNPHDVGEKQHMDHPQDSSTYSDVHAKYHPIVRSYLDKFGYYDIFFFFFETGHIV